MVASDGAFAIDGLSPGRARLALVRLGSAATGHPSAPSLIFEEQVDLAPGTNVVELDAVGRWPGALALLVTAGGAPAPGLRVDLFRRGEKRWPWLGPFRTNAAGRLALEPPAGTYMAKISFDGLWSWQTPEDFEVRPGAPAEVALELPHAAGALRVLDAATGAPLAGLEVHLLRMTDGGARRTTKRTDAAGELLLVLPELTLYASRTALPADATAAGLAECARVAWPASGRVALAVELR